MFRQWSVQSEPAPRRPEPQAASEELWEQEVERLCASRTPVRMLPYAMADKRFIRWVPLGTLNEPAVGRGKAPEDAPVMDDSRAPPSSRFCRKLREPEGVKTFSWQPWHRPRWVARQHLRETSHRLARGFRLWEGALYEIGGLFGTGIQSYFTFLRFLLLLNLLIILLTACLVLLPQVWLRPPEPGPALKLSECWGCPDPVGISLGMLHGLALDSPRHDLLPGRLPAQRQTASVFG